MNMTISQTLLGFPDLLKISEFSEQQINKFSKSIFFGNKRTIINKGDQVSGAYLVLRGSLRLYSIDQNGKEKTSYEVLPGESCLLAMNSLFSGLHIRLGQNVLDEALSLSIEQRVASYLSRKANIAGTIKVSHQEIASELGTAREVISRILKKMEKSECIALSRGLITINSIKRLNQFS